MNRRHLPSGRHRCIRPITTLAVAVVLVGVVGVVLWYTNLGDIRSCAGLDPAPSSPASPGRAGSKDVNPDVKKSWIARWKSSGPVTQALILVNTIQFLRVCRWPNVEDSGTPPKSVDPSSVIAEHPVKAGKRIVAAGFSHGNIVHFLLNMRALWSFGPLVEREKGSLQMLAIYLSGCIAGTLTDFAYQQRGKSQWNPVLGASGGVMALVGTAGGSDTPLLFSVGPGILEVILLALMDGQEVQRLEEITEQPVVRDLFKDVSHLSHLGGFLVGLAFRKFGAGVAAPLVGAFIAFLAQLIDSGSSQPMHPRDKIRVTGVPLAPAFNWIRSKATSSFGAMRARLAALDDMISL
ncbi:unnamed protein product (mitochondrion) [Plasmodiophora brassicae]|uniref:Peptidase S54 rhomboid domain-containing protein n=1 Tax=Plasmodiophora brassicae TaxID=37360 RepID=A0A0G4IPG4_PLABS|nr:hypothetical protein PBRA_005658 [Plasmodiophora brassicae]SPR01036.1 unnamed protein product [Plasmodiophora brassicae]